MYNTFLHQRISDEKQQKLSNSKNSQKFRLKQLKLRQKLINDYDKRILTFISKMDEQPIFINDIDDQKLRLYNSPFRQSKKQGLFQKTRIIFRSPEDWKSYFTENERRQKQADFQFGKSLKLSSQLIHRNLRSQSIYQGNQKIDKYRKREIQKQIQQYPMVFTLKNRKLLHKQKNFTQAIQKIINQDEEQQFRRNITNSSVGMDEENSLLSKKMRQNSNQFKNLSESKFTDNQSKISTYLVKKLQNTTKNQRKAVNLQNQKSTKMYFKGAMQVSIRKNKYSKTAQNILQKCRYIKQRKKQKIAQQDLFDAFNQQSNK